MRAKAEFFFNIYTDETIDISTIFWLDLLKLCLVKQKAGNYIIMHSVIWANQKNESFVLHWLCANAMFDIRCVPAFVLALDIISALFGHVTCAQVTMEEYIQD